MKKRFTEAQIVGFLREVDADVTVKEQYPRRGPSESSLPMEHCPLSAIARLCPPFGHQLRRTP